MNINHHNYEMYFLLYVDNELCAADRNLVDRFVAENADLKNELYLLQSTRLPLDAVRFTSKNSLLRHETAPDHLQENILLLLDNELEESEKKIVELEIADNDDLKRTWDILQQTKLDANEQVIFEDKKLLYRYEREKLIPVRFWRMAAAAGIIGLILFVGISLYTKNKEVENIAVNEQPSTPSKRNGQPGMNTIEEEENVAAGQEKRQDLAATQQKQSPANDNDQIKTDDPQKSLATQKDNAQKQVAIKILSDKERRSSENFNNKKSNDLVSSNVQDKIKVLTNKKGTVVVAEKEIALNKITAPSITIVDKEITGTANSYAKNAMLDESASALDNNQFLFISEEKINRSKVGGLFRKVKRVITRNANIKTGNGIKIAGFEVALQ